LWRRPKDFSYALEEHFAGRPDSYRYSRFRGLDRGWAMKLPVTMAHRAPEQDSELIVGLKDGELAPRRRDLPPHRAAQPPGAC